VQIWTIIEARLIKAIRSSESQLLRTQKLNINT